LHERCIRRFRAPRGGVDHDEDVADGTDGSTDRDDRTAAAVDAAADTLYAAAPDDFMALRADLAARARQDGDAAAAKRIGGLRKPTVAASVVNRLIHDAPERVEQLTELGERLRAAQDDLDATLLRDLSMERRALVGSLARTAFTVVGQDSPSTALHDEVVATLDAAVADPAVAGRLGRLVRPERWSGFGFAAVAGPPELTVVRGGRDTSRRSSGRAGSSGRSGSRIPAPSPPEAEPPPKRETDSGSAEQRRRARAVEKARAAFHTADEALDAAAEAEDSASRQVRALTDEIAERQRSLDDLKRELDGLRREHRAAKARRREARSALDRAERSSQR
jgi:hypothetical protein